MLHPVRALHGPLCALAVCSALVLLGCGGSVPSSGGDTSDVPRLSRALADRPFSLPRLRSSDDCPFAGAISFPGISGEGVLGPHNQNSPNGERQLARLRRGPVYAGLPGIPRILTLSLPGPGSSTESRPWVEALITWVGKRRYRGPVLVRGGRLDGQGRIGFGGGTSPEFELRLPAGTWADAGTGGRDRSVSGWRIAKVESRFRSAGCYAFQVDGRKFSYALPFQVFAN